jgi:SAM-dependent methyltransferase
MGYVTSFYPESRFGGFTDIDGTNAFFLRVNSLVTPDSIVIDFGCGRGAHLEDAVPLRRGLRVLKGKCRRVIGMDVDEAARDNPFLDEFRPLVAGRNWPAEDRLADLVVCDFVVEHLPEPAIFFQECRRVLRPGTGYVCIRTPNVMSYVGIISSLVPNKHHTAMLKKAQPGRRQEDVFPTVYKCNTVRKLRHMLTKFGFENAVYGYEAEPSYLSFGKPFYALGVLHQKFAPGFLKPTIFAFGRLL